MWRFLRVCSMQMVGMDRHAMHLRMLISMARRASLPNDPDMPVPLTLQLAHRRLRQGPARTHPPRDLLGRVGQRPARIRCASHAAYDLM